MAAQPLGGHPSLCLSWYLQLLSPATRPAWEVATESLGLSCPHQPGDLTVRPQQIPWSPLERPNLADALIPSRPSYLPSSHVTTQERGKTSWGIRDMVSISTTH